MKEVAVQNSVTVEYLKSRKSHLLSLLKLVDTNSKKQTKIEKLFIAAINAEIECIEGKPRKN